MVLVDTSIWIDHFRKADAALVQLLDAQQVLMHPYIIGELACGNLSPRDDVLNLLSMLPSARFADTHEVLYFIEANHLYGKGIGYVDAHLLSSVALERTATLWTRDKRLDNLARSINLNFVAP
jgi:predicted nucleic acid-binding protein